jgi:GrpB-like predicted nucleotidyltransferase (UPF0157 family)
MGIDTEPIEIHPYDQAWPTLFSELGSRLRSHVGLVASRIDHIGSTAVAKLAAKPIIDIQISVASLDPVAPFLRPLQASGLRYVADNPELTKRFFREQPGGRRTHVHVRRAGSFSEQFALLFRDFLRAHDTEADGYGRHKEELARRYRHDRDAYVTAKTPQIWEIIRRADTWAQRTGWEPPASDA